MLSRTFRPPPFQYTQTFIRVTSIPFAFTIAALRKLLAGYHCQWCHLLQASKARGDKSSRGIHSQLIGLPEEINSCWQWWQPTNGRMPQTVRRYRYSNMQTGRDAEIGWFPNQWWNNVPFAAPRLPSPDQVWWTANDFATHRLARAYTISLESSFFLLSFIANRVFSTWDWQTRFQWMNKKKSNFKILQQGSWPQSDPATSANVGQGPRVGPLAPCY